MPDTTPADDLASALRLLVHELRTPVSVAQGYLRLLLEDRISDVNGRQQAIVRSIEALGRITAICGDVSEYADTAATPKAHLHPLSEVVEAVRAEAEKTGLILNVGEPLPAAQLRTLAPARAAAAIAAIIRAAVRAEVERPPQLSAAVVHSDLVVATGDEAIRARLLAPAERAALDVWRGGHGFSVPLAVRQLTETGTCIWTLADEPGAVAIAIPLELLA